MEGLMLPLVLVILWIIMKKNNKEALGTSLTETVVNTANIVRVGSEKSAEHLALAADSAKVNTLADMQENFKERGIVLSELIEFQEELHKAFGSTKPTKPTKHN